MSRQKVPYLKFKPEKMNDATWRTIVESWENGLPDSDIAFLLAKTDETKEMTADEIRQLCKDNPKVGELRAMLLSSLMTSARTNVADAIREGDVKTSKWYLERKAADEFSTKQAVAFEGAVIELSLEEKEKALKDLVERFDSGEEE